MSTGIFLLVLLAALLHAVWNALVKSDGDKLVAMAAVVVGQGLCGALILPFAPRPDLAMLPYLAAGVALHLGYQLFLMKAYRIGDLTQVYPIARGTAPLIVAAVTVGLMGAELSLVELAGIVVIASGIMSLCLLRQSDGGWNAQAVMLAVVTGCFIAGYSIVDGTGARVAGTALGFYGWLAALNAVGFVAIMGVRAPGAMRRLPGALRMVVVGGGASFTAYTLVVYAFTQAPIAMVTALRETSIVFALLIGVVFLKERLDLAKLVSTTITLSGAALLRLAKG